MSLTRKIFSSTLYQVLGKFVTIALSIVTIKIITTYLGGVEAYGEYTTIYEYLAFFAIGADMGIYAISIREISKSKERADYILGNIVALRTVLIALLITLASVTAFFIPQYASTRIALGVCIASLSVFFTMVHGSICSLLQVHYHMGIATLTTIIGKFIMVGYIVFIVFYATPAGLVSQEMGFFHLLYAGVLGNLIMYILVRIYSARLCSWRLRFDFAFWKQILTYAIPYGTALILHTIYFRVDAVLLSLMRADYLTQVGVYGVAMRILDALTIIPIYFMNSVLPVMSDYVKNKEKDFRHLLQSSFDFLALMAIPLLIGGFLLSSHLIAFISNANYLTNLSLGFYGSDLVLQILLFALLLVFFNTLFGYSLLAISQQRVLLRVNGYAALFNLVSNVIVIPYWGFVGAALTSVFSELVVLVLLYAYIKRQFDFQFDLKRLAKIIISASLMGLVVYLLRDSFVGHWWLLLLPIGFMVYMLAVMLFKIIDDDLQRRVLGKKYF